MKSFLNLKDLKNGTGEWENIQEILRESFLYTFEKIQQQNEKLKKNQKKNELLENEIEKLKKFVKNNSHPFPPHHIICIS